MIEGVTNWQKGKKEGFLQTAALLMRANERVFMGFGQNTEEVMIDALSQSQETALLLGTELGKMWEKQIWSPFWKYIVKIFMR